VVLSVLLLLFLFAACCDDNNGSKPAPTGRVTFQNDSSYLVKVRRGSFAGPVLFDPPLNAGGSVTVNVQVSETVFGTTFSMEYLFLINHFLELIDPVYGEIYASGVDFNIQPSLVIEKDKAYTMQIPQPANLEHKGAFIAITNMHNQPVEFRNMSGTLGQAGNNSVSIQPNMIGVYKFENIPNEGKKLEGHFIRQVFDNWPFTEIDMENGFVYRYGFDGTMVKELKPPLPIMSW